ncbi:hypothetical protein [Salipiger bermudensis]|uniref:Uncharacterized protein n=1 Tax=Salipiger bermudensis (strain DSM 26914 / JCM 13377 / KCTC 12554 / HTCC2601) TaxID=314265 RepID=Q0FH96_SALBH|nr:hypothetical protein [Salipiger bermudensis]EAU43555.1 hypothetical protein R2601_24040 [Salipiger bermudensis HTCC2601]
MAWYSAGTVSVTNGSATVTGSGTAWVANAQASEGIWLPDGQLYEIVSINSDTSLTISPNYLGTTQSGQVYRIVPVKGYPLVAAQQMASLISTVQSYVDGALSGRFGNGTVGAPGISFASNTAMGLYRVAANQLGFVTNGVRRMLLTTSALTVDVPIVGGAIQDNSFDTDPSTIMKVGAFGLGGSGLALNSSGDYNALDNISMFHGNTSGSSMPANGPVTTGLAGFRTIPGPGRGAELLMKSQGAGGAGKSEMYFRGLDSTWGEWDRVLQEKDQQTDEYDGTAGALMGVGAFGLGTDAVWDYLVIADDGFGEFVPPRAGGLVSIISFPVKGSGFPTLSESGVFLIDAGATNGIITLHAGTYLDTSVSSGDPATGTSGLDGNLTIFLPQNGNLQIENRSGSSRAIRIGWL